MMFTLSLIWIAGETWSFYSLLLGKSPVEMSVDAYKTKELQSNDQDGLVKNGTLVFNGNLLRNAK